MVIRPLAASDFDAVFTAFNEAFSDYVVPLTLSREQFAEMMQRRGWVPEKSVAAFDDERIVAFTLNAVEGDRSYDTGTGVVPGHRRQGLAKQLMECSFELLRGTAYVLEVIEANEKAVALYRGLGFEEARRLQCWRLEAHVIPKRSEGSGGWTQEAHHPAARSLATLRDDMWDIRPSWQNSTASMKRANDEHVIIGNEHGYAIVFPSNGDLPQLAVKREARRNGLGTRLLQAAAAIAAKPLRILNIDDRDAGIAAFLEAAGATRTVRQLEMERNLSC